MSEGPNYKYYREMVEQWKSENKHPRLMFCVSQLFNDHIKVANYLRAKGYKVTICSTYQTLALLEVERKEMLTNKIN